MGLPLYVAPVESDVRHKISSQSGTQARTRARGTRTRSTEFLRETRRRAILAATTAVRNRRDALLQDTSEMASAHRSSQDRSEQDEQAWQHPGTEPHHMYGFDPEASRTYNSAIGELPPDVQQYIQGAENPSAARSTTALPVTARDHFSRRRPLDRPLDAARYNPYSEQDADNLLALFSEHWASVGPGTDSLPASTGEGAPARSGGGGRIPAHRFDIDGFVDESLSQFGTDSDTDGYAASSRASRIRRRRPQRHTSSLPLGLTYSRPTVGWSDNQERTRSRSPVSSSRVYGNVSHIRGADVIYPEERTRHTAQVEWHRTNLLNRTARRSARNTPRAADTTTDAHRSGNYRTSTITAGLASADANPGTVASSQPNLPPFRYMFGPSASIDGLGDRQRSLSPEGDGVWDTLQTTVTPDPQPPSVGSSFASFPSGRAAVEQNAGHDDEDGGLTLTVMDPATREAVPGADEGDDDVTLTLDPPQMAQTRPTTDAAPDAHGTREDAGGALPPDAVSASTAHSRRPVLAGAVRRLHELVGRREANSGEDADCIEGSEADDRRRDERRTEPVRHGETETTRGPTNEGADAGILGMSHGPRHPWQEDLATVIRSGDYALSQSLLGGRLGFNDGGMISTVSPTPTAGTPHNESMGQSRMSGMQHFVRNLAQRQDIPDEWWAEVGLSRTLHED